MPYPYPVSATTSSVASSATVVTLLGVNTSRVGVIVVNDSSAVLYLKYGATATTSDYTFKILAGETKDLTVPIYQGVITGIWASANGAAKITELVLA